MKNVAIIKKDNHYTVAATKEIKKGELIFKLQGAISTVADKYSIQLGKDKHLFPLSENPLDDSSTFMFLNHSCSPNSYFNLGEDKLIALKNILVDEEINYHYCTTEYEISKPFTCHCGSNNCLREIKGYKYLSESIKYSLALYTATHLKNSVKIIS